MSHGTDSYGWPLHSGEFEVIHASWMAKDQGQEAPFRGEQLLDSSKANDTFPTLIPAWFELQRKLKGPMLEYFSIQMFGRMTAEEAFLRITRSLEATHGILDPSPHIPADDWAVARKAIKDALVGNPHEDFLLSRTKFLHLPSLRERLLTLFSIAGPKIRRHVPEGVECFVKKVVATRNNMTHSGENGPLGGSELHRALVVLDLLMCEVLLVQLGFSAEEADDQVFKTERSRLLVYSVQ